MGPNPASRHARVANRCESRSLALVLLAVVLALAGCGHTSSPVHGSEKSLTQPRQVASFDRVAVNGALELVVQVGAPQAVELSGDDDIVPLFRTTVQGSTLDIHPTRSYTWRAHEPQVRLTVPNLTGLEASGALTGTLSGLSGMRFSLTVSGAVTLHADGTVDALSVHASGATTLDLAAVATHTVDLDASGATHLAVQASEAIRGSMSGMTVVTYTGSPTVSVHTSGVSQIQPR